MIVLCCFQIRRAIVPCLLLVHAQNLQVLEFCEENNIRMMVVLQPT